jgi:hypothetical protein
MITRLRNDFIVGKTFNKYFDFEYVQKFNWFVQSKTAYRNTFRDEDDFEVNVVSQTKRQELEHWLALWYKFTPETAISWRVGEEEQVWNASDAENRPDRSQKDRITGPQVRFPVTKNANFIFSYTDKVTRGQNENELGQFRADNTEFTLLSFVRF